jgi:hypothetical protein
MGQFGPSKSLDRYHKTWKAELSMTVGLLPHLALNKKTGIANVTLAMPVSVNGPSSPLLGISFKRLLHG